MTVPLSAGDGGDGRTVDNAPSAGSPQTTTASQPTPAQAIPSADAWLETQFRQYQLFVETAERNSDRRAVANRLYITLHTALLTLLAIVGGYGLVVNIGSGMPIANRNDFLSMAQTPIVVVVTLLGVALCVVWGTHIASFRQISAAKFKVINDTMEPKLPFQPFRDEWEALQKQKRRYTQFSVIERIIMWLTALLYLAWLVIYLVITIHAQYPRFPSL